MPIPSTGLLAWFDPTVDSAFTYSNGNDGANPGNTYVSKWNDLSGLNNHAVGNGNAGYHPKRNVTINGLKAVDYSQGAVAVYKALGIPTIPYEKTKPVSYFFVTRIPSAILADSQFNGANGTAVGLRIKSNGALEFIAPGVAQWGTTAAGVVAASGTYLIGATYSPTGVYSIRVNGSVVSSGTANYSMGTGGVTGLGSVTDNTGSFAGYLAEYIMYDRVLTAQEITDTETYLTSKWIPATPPFTTTGMYGWWDATDASTFTLTTGAQFTQWRDKSANANHLTAEYDHVNLVRSGDINGKVAVLSNHPSVPMRCQKTGVNVLSLLDGTNKTDCMNFTVVKFINNPGPYFSLVGGTYRVQLESPVGGGVSYCDVVNHLGGRLSGSLNFAINTPYIVGFYRNGANMAVTINGTTILSKSNASDVAATETAVLNLLGGNINMGEAIHISRYNAAQFNEIQSYLSDKWGILLIPTTGLVSWWDADDASTFTYSSGVVVSQWRDKIGTCHLNQATESARPTRNGTQNGHTTVVFDPVWQQNVKSSAPAMTAVNNFTIFVACKRTAADGAPGGTNTVIPFSNGDPGGSGGYGIALKANSANIGWIDYGIAWNSSTTPDPKAAGVLTLRRTSGTWSMHLNGVATNIALTETPNAPTGFAAIPSGNNLLGGEVYEVLAYNVALSDAERQQVENYLKAKWGTP